MGGGLPPRHRMWVLHDVTTRWWRFRALFRSLVQLAPVALLIYLLLPSEPWVRVLAILGGMLVGLIYALAYLEESSEHRAIKAGYARGTARAVREQADVGAQAAVARYAARYRDDGGTTPSSSG